MGIQCKPSNNRLIGGTDMNKNQIQLVASEIRNFLPQACSDMAEGQSMLQKEIAADEAYDDEAILSDLTGDRIYDACRGDYCDMIDVAVEIRDSRYTHQPLKNVMGSHISRWMKALDKLTS
jgi:hypothetical protein